MLRKTFKDSLFLPGTLLSISTPIATIADYNYVINVYSEPGIELNTFFGLLHLILSYL